MVSPQESIMRQTLRLFPCFLLLALLSCNTTEWIHPLKHRDQFAKDQARCEERVLSGPTMEITSPYKTDRAIRNCLKELGWVERAKRRT